MATIDLDDYEEEVVRFLATRYHQGGKYVQLSEFPRYEEVGQDRVFRVVARFENYLWIDSYASDMWTISGLITDIADRLDNPPPDDYRQTIEAWFFSKWWSVPLWLLFILPPAIVGYVEFVKALIEWFTGKQ
jgi:hypothetical protein